MDGAAEDVHFWMSTNMFGQFQMFTNMFGDVPYMFET